MDESTLLKSAKKLDQGALVTIFNTYAPDVYRYAFRLYRDPIRSDNLVGEVFSQFLENVVNDQAPSFNLRVYIFQITYQKIIGRLDDDQPIAVKAIQPRLGSKDVTTATQQDENERLLMQFLGLLKTELNAIQRHILFLRYLEDFSLNETAFIVGKSVSNVKVIQNRASTKLQRLVPQLP
jgi:RNA polymerase sigma-70 factor, ECF subfamily